MGFVGGFFDGVARFIGSLFGWAGNSFADSKALQEELAKEQQSARGQEDQGRPRS